VIAVRAFLLFDAFKSNFVSICAQSQGISYLFSNVEFKCFLGISLVWGVCVCVCVCIQFDLYIFLDCFGSLVYQFKFSSLSLHQVKLVKVNNFVCLFVCLF
jgi:hypothetical protein